MKNRNLQSDGSGSAWFDRVAYLAGMVLLSAGLTGCAHFRTELGKPLAVDKGSFVEGETSVHTVVHALGPPNQVSALPDGFAFLYEHSVVKELQIGFSLDFPLLRWLKLIWAMNSLDQDLCLMTFDDEGRLKAIGVGHSSEDLGGGKAIQFIVSVISLTDSSAFRRPADAHSWGAACLGRLPRTLNADQNLRTGAHGLQLRTAPKYAGQHTLEMAKPAKLKIKRRGKNPEPF